MGLHAHRPTHKGHHPHSHTWSTHGRKQTLTPYSIDSCNLTNPSDSAALGKGDGVPSRRFLSEDDVYGIALVWWLFEGGLRSETIQYVLNQICRRKKKATATEAALILRDDDADILAIKRQPRMGLLKGELYPKQDVILLLSALGGGFF